MTPRRVKMKIKEKKHRVSLDFSEEAYKRLAELQEEGSATSQAEVIRRALSLYSLFIEREQDRYELHYIRDDEDQRVELVF
jgi:Arc/MetJ-type ribon-helix-helix transcriptional regulator